MNKTTDLLNQIRALIADARHSVAKSADFVQVWTCYQIGWLITENEQHGVKRAGYAEKTIVVLSQKLTKEFGRGFAKRNLEYMRQFYQMYNYRIAQPPIGQSSDVRMYPIRKSVISISGKSLSQSIAQSLIAQSSNQITSPITQSLIAQSTFIDIFKLSWTHYLFLMSIDAPDERSFYEIESAAQNWTVRELRRQFNTSLYERLSLSRNKAKVKELSQKGHVIEKPEDAIKEPVVLEF
jgi:hypothetical protein